MSYCYEKLTAPIEQRDADSIRGLYQEYDSLVDPGLHYHWLFESEYFYRGDIHHFVIRSDGDIVGFTSLIVRQHAGLRLGSMLNFLVGEKHRSLGPAMAVQRLLLSHAHEHRACDLLLGMPNRNSLMICKRIGYRFVDVAQRYVLVTDPAGYFNRHTPMSHGLGGIYTMLLKLALSIYKNSAEMRAGKACSTDSKILERRQVGRDQLDEYECWRYLESPARDYYYYYPSGNPAPESALMVFCLNNDSLCVDRLRNVDATELERSLLDLIFKALHAFRFRSVQINAVLSQEYKAHLGHIGFIDRTDSYRPMIAMPTSSRDLDWEYMKKSIYPVVEGDLDI